MTQTIESTIEFIKQAHADQTYNGQPYHTHPIAVMHQLGDAPLDVKLAALLHDVLEDTNTTANDLRQMGYPERTVYLVEMLTRPAAGTPNRPTYMEWIRSLAATKDYWLIRLKLADNMVNLSTVDQLPPEKRDIANRYERSVRILKKALETL